MNKQLQEFVLENTEKTDEEILTLALAVKGTVGDIAYRTVVNYDAQTKVKRHILEIINEEDVDLDLKYEAELFLGLVSTPALDPINIADPTTQYALTMFVNHGGSESNFTQLMRDKLELMATGPAPFADVILADIEQCRLAVRTECYQTNYAGTDQWLVSQPNAKTDLIVELDAPAPFDLTFDVYKHIAKPDAIKTDLANFAKVSQVVTKLFVKAGDTIGATSITGYLGRHTRLTTECEFAIAHQLNVAGL